jgi:hypothetical protein
VEPTGSIWAVSSKTCKALRRIRCPSGAANFGWTLARVDDVDGDGVADVAASAQFVSSESIPKRTYQGGSPVGEGAVYLFSGKSGALLRSWSGPADTTKVPWHSAGAGPSLACVGDWDGDGVGDVAIGWSYADSADGSIPDAGRVDVVSGKSGAVLRSWQGAEAHDRFGFALTAVADLDGDDKRELAASAMPDFGGPESAGAHPNLSKIRAGYVWVLSSKGGAPLPVTNPEGSRRFGFSIRWLGPAQPGIHLGVGQAHRDDHHPCAWVIDTPDAKSLHRFAHPGDDAWNGDWKGKGVTPAPSPSDDSFGSQLLELRDFDGDGLRDVLVTMPQAFSEVPAVVLSGKTGGVLARVDLRDVPGSLSHVGNAVCALRDVDGDGVDDFAIGGASIRNWGCDGVVVLCSGKDAKPIRAILRHELVGRSRAK